MKMTWWMKILLGIGGIGLLVWLTEIEQWVMLFWWPFVILMMTFSALGLISDGAFEAVTGFLPRVMSDIKERVNHHLEEKRAHSVS